MRGALLSLLLLAIGLSSCGGGASKESISLDISGIPVESAPWYLYTYGAHNITIDTLEVTDSGKISWHKAVDIDTLDLFLLLNHQGLLELPLFPSRDGSIKAKMGKKGVSLEGVQQADSVASWYQSKQAGIAALHTFLTHYDSSPVAFVMAVDAVRRDVNGECTEDLIGIQSMLANQHHELARLLGISQIVQYQQPSITNVPYAYRIAGQKELRKLKDLISNRELMVINVMKLTPQDTLAYKRQKGYLEQLTQLGIISYNVLLNDQLPSGLAQKDRYFLLDSVGYSVEYIRDYNIKKVPTYMLVDSLHQVWRTYSDADSLVQFIKEYREDVGN